MLEVGKKLVFDLTEDDIRGADKTSSNCPVARAVKRTVDENRKVRVSYSTIDIYGKSTENTPFIDPEFVVKIPEVLGREIRTYDETGKMRTFHARLTVNAGK